MIPSCAVGTNGQLFISVKQHKSINNRQSFELWFCSSTRDRRLVIDIFSEFLFSFSRFQDKVIFTSAWRKLHPFNRNVRSPNWSGTTLSMFQDHKKIIEVQNSIRYHFAKFLQLLILEDLSKWKAKGFCSAWLQYDT